ncbi:SirB2 family protein [Spiribacter pallidus]|uniref:SirB2 family protein n=1 Tax=Spiribacter pallidus TaxID=1987936 RepID=A0ABV3TDQ0_9GAMM
MLYIGLNHLHTTVVTLSLLLFVLRFGLVTAGSDLASRKWLRITPHAINTLLLVTAFGVAWAGWNYPAVLHGWINAKVLGLIAYIALGVLAFKTERSLGARVGYFIGALVIYGYLVAVALAKSAWPF